MGLSPLLPCSSPCFPRMECCWDIRLTTNKSDRLAKISTLWNMVLTLAWLDCNILRITIYYIKSSELVRLTKAFAVPMAELILEGWRSIKLSSQAGSSVWNLLSSTKDNVCLWNCLSKFFFSPRRDDEQDVDDSVLNINLSPKKTLVLVLACLDNGQNGWWWGLTIHQKSLRWSFF